MLQKVISGCLDFRVAIATRRLQTVKFRITSNKRAGPTEALTHVFPSWYQMLVKCEERHPVRVHTWKSEPR